MDSYFATEVEFKFADDGEPGAFDGHGAIFGNRDERGDIIEPGAFASTLAQHKARGTAPAMFVEHSAFVGGDRLPVGKWIDVAENDHGLAVKGIIGAMDTDYGRRIHWNLKNRTMSGLSIAFVVPAGGASIERKGGESTRRIKALHLEAIDIVRDPANPLARIDGVKSMMMNADAATATQAVADAIRLHRTALAGGDAPTADERAQMMQCLQKAHQALTGDAMPAGMKSARPTLRELKGVLKREFGLSNSEADYVVEHGLKSLPPLGEDGEAAKIAARAQLVRSVADLLGGFSLKPPT